MHKLLAEPFFLIRLDMSSLCHSLGVRIAHCLLSAASFASTAAVVGLFPPWASSSLACQLVSLSLQHVQVIPKSARLQPATYLEQRVEAPVLNESIPLLLHQAGKVPPVPFLLLLASRQQSPVTVAGTTTCCCCVSDEGCYVRTFLVLSERC